MATLYLHTWLLRRWRSGEGRQRSTRRAWAKEAAGRSPERDRAHHSRRWLGEGGAVRWCGAASHRSWHGRAIVADRTELSTTHVQARPEPFQICCDVPRCRWLCSVRGVDDCSVTVWWSSWLWAAQQVVWELYPPSARCTYCSSKGVEAPQDVRPTIASTGSRSH